MDRLSKIIDRFQAKIDSGSFYEAHQTLRTIANRFIKGNQPQLAIQLLSKGASILTIHKEYASASDLIGYLVQVYVDFGISVDDKSAKMKLIDLVSGLPPSEPSLVELSTQCLKWSSSNGGAAALKFGDCQLHHVFGTMFLKRVEEEETDDNVNKSKYFALAEIHLVLGTFDSVPLYVNYLIRCSEANPDTDPGVFLSRAIINYLYLNNIKFAQEAQDLFVKKLNGGIPTNGINYFDDYPLVNFIQLLLVVFKKEHASNSNQFMRLYTQYKPVLNNYGILAAIEYLGRTYFQLRLGQQQQGNMLANLMGGLFK
ncbi:Golgi to ER traffic protein 4 [Spathaspora sp. JA1]|nr:Golgi to ER traffic protein 4 [Spathaspora sp. JA1]